MAGSYADVPSRRMAWDADGTVGVWQIFGQNWTELSPSQTVELNDEDETNVNLSGANATHRTAIIFPELREVDGFFARGARAPNFDVNGDVEVSSDTTNGEDGTWVTAIASYNPVNTKVYADGEYRNAITSLAQNARRAVRFRGVGSAFNYFLRAVHIYGAISPGETPDRLLWIDQATGLEFAAPVDYGDVPRGSARDVEVRLKNNSASLTAATIQYTAEDLYLGSGAWYTFTTPGGAVYSATQQIASLGAGATTGLIRVRQVIPDAATLGLHAARAYTDVTSWS